MLKRTWIISKSTRRKIRLALTTEGAKMAYSHHMKLSKRRRRIDCIRWETTHNPFDKMMTPQTTAENNYSTPRSDKLVILWMKKPPGLLKKSTPTQKRQLKKQHLVSRVATSRQSRNFITRCFNKPSAQILAIGFGGRSIVAGSCT